MDKQLQEELKTKKENPTIPLIFNQEWTGRRMGRRFDECQRCGGELQGVFYEWMDRITKKQVIKSRCCEMCYNDLPTEDPGENLNEPAFHAGNEEK